MQDAASNSAMINFFISFSVKPVTRRLLHLRSRWKLARRRRTR
jgi:hypothetical protein